MFVGFFSLSTLCPSAVCPRCEEFITKSYTVLLPHTRENKLSLKLIKGDIYKQTCRRKSLKFIKISDVHSAITSCYCINLSLFVYHCSYGIFAKVIAL